jgi:hypothetical protein
VVADVYMTSLVVRNELQSKWPKKSTQDIYATEFVARDRETREFVSKDRLAIGSFAFSYRHWCKANHLKSKSDLGNILTEAATMR